jgi:TRAP-type C4-dicarboxylate transport system permease small subunit
MLLDRLKTFSKWVQGAALAIGVIGFFATFTLFIYSITMRHVFDQPQTWTDEAVSIATTWLVFWTSAFVLKWSEFISFDVIYRQVPVSLRRWVVLAGALTFLVVICAALWYIADFVMFMAISRTDMLQIPLDQVYSVFVIFLLIICIRILVLCYRLAFGDANAALEELEALPNELN